MLRYAEQDAFEAWLRTCPLPSRALTYSVTKSGEDSVLTVDCRWRVPSAASRWDEAAEAERLGAEVVESIASGPLEPVSGSTAARERVAAPSASEASQEVSEAGQEALLSGKQSIASLQSSLEAMKGMFAARGVSPDAMMAMMGQCGGDGASSGGGAGAGGSGGSGGGAALAAMLLQQRAAMADGPGAPPRTDPESVRAVLGMCQGFVQPKPPGS